MLVTIYRWGDAAFNSVLWNIPTLADQVLDSRVVQTHVGIDALCEQRWPPIQHAGMKSGHMLHLLCHEGPLRTVCLQRDSGHVCLYLHHNTVKHGCPGVMKESTKEWNGTLLSSVMGVNSFCMRVMDVHV